MNCECGLEMETGDKLCPRCGRPPCSTPLVVRLVDAAMEIAMFDFDWKDNSIPEVKYHRDLFTERFSEIIGDRR